MSNIAALQPNVSVGSPSGTSNGEVYKLLSMLREAKLKIFEIVRDAIAPTEQEKKSQEALAQLKSLERKIISGEITDPKEIRARLAQIEENLWRI